MRKLFVIPFHLALLLISCKGESHPAKQQVPRTKPAQKSEDQRPAPQQKDFIRFASAHFQDAAAYTHRKLVFSPDDKRLLSGDTSASAIWEVASGKKISAFHGLFAIAHDWSYLAHSSDRDIWIYDLRKEKRGKKLSGHRSRITALAFSRDSRFLASAADRTERGGTRRGTFRIWDIKAAKSLREIPELALKMAFGPNAQMLATTGYQSYWLNGRPIRVWKISNGKTLYKVTYNNNSLPKDAWRFCTDFSISVDGRHLVTLCTYCEFEGHTCRGPAHCKKYHKYPGKKDNFQVGFHRLSNGQLLFSKEAKHVRRLKLSPDSRHLALVTCLHQTRDKTAKACGIELYKVRVTGLVHTASLHTRLLKAPATCFNADGKMRTTCEDEHILIALPALSFSPNSKILATSGNDQHIRLWDVGSGKLVQRINIGKGPVSSVAFSHDGKSLAVGIARDLTIWDLSQIL